MGITEIKIILQKEHNLAKRLNNLATKYITANIDEKSIIKESIEEITMQIKSLNNEIPRLITQIETSRPVTRTESVNRKQLVNLPKKIEGKKLKKTDEILEELGVERAVLKRGRKELSKKVSARVEGKPSFYVKISNKLFSRISDILVKK